MWPVTMSAVLMPTRLCCTWIVQTPGWAPHKIYIPILLCVSGVFLGSASSINITAPCVARPTTLRIALAAMSRVTCLLSSSCRLCHQYLAILGHLVSVHDKISGICFFKFLKTVINWKTYPTFNALKVFVTWMCLYMYLKVTIWRTAQFTIIMIKWLLYCEWYTSYRLLNTHIRSKVLKASHQLSRPSGPCLTHSAIFW